MERIEQVDELTNAVMDVIRRRFNIDEDSNLDDEIYAEIHQAIKETFLEITELK